MQEVRGSIPLGSTTALDNLLILLSNLVSKNRRPSFYPTFLVRWREATWGRAGLAAEVGEQAS